MGNAASLEGKLQTHFMAGQRVHLILEVPHDLDIEDLHLFQSRLMKEGLKLLAPVELNERPFPYSLHLQLRIPREPVVVPLLCALKEINLELGQWEFQGISRMRMSHA